MSATTSTMASRFTHRYELRKRAKKSCSFICESVFLRLLSDCKVTNNKWKWNHVEALFLLGNCHNGYMGGAWTAVPVSASYAQVGFAQQQRRLPCAGSLRLFLRGLRPICRGSRSKR